MSLPKLAGSLICAVVLGLALVTFVTSRTADSHQTQGPCDGLSIPENSVTDMRFDPVTGDPTVSYLDDGEHTVQIDANDPSCSSNESVRRIIQPARASVEAERRSVCAGARAFLERGPTNEKARGVSRADAEKVDRDCRSGKPR